MSFCEEEERKTKVVVLTADTEADFEEDTLEKETIRTMGYARSGAALAAAAERGLKYGRRSGEIIQNAEKLFELNARSD